MEKLALGIVWYVVFVFSTAVHEYAHAWWGYKLGDRTAHEAGLRTLQPMAHILRSPIGMVVVPILSFVTGGWMVGWASVPYDPEWAMRYPKRSAQMAMMGPMANFGLVVLAGIAIRIGLWQGWFYAPERLSVGAEVASYASTGLYHGLAVLLSIMFSLNLVMVVFNLIPFPPLDGSSILGLFLSESTARKFMVMFSQPTLSVVGLLIAWRGFDAVFGPIHLGAVNLLYFLEGHYG